MKKIIKIIALFCMTTILLSLLGACGEKPYVCTCDVIELTFSFWGDASELESTKAILDVYNNAQDRIHVTPMQIPNHLYGEEILSMSGGGNMPDCGMVNERDTIRWANENILTPFDIYAGQAIRPKDVITFKDDGNIITFSIASEVLALWFNRDLFDEAGIAYPPTTLETAWTWDEFIEVAKQLTFDADGKTPNDPGFDKDNIVQYGAYVNQWAWQMEVWALSNGGSWYSQDGKSVVFDAAAIEAMQKVYDLHLVHNVAPHNSAQQDNGYFESVGMGNVAMCTDGQWVAGFSAFNEINYGVGILPYMKQHANIATGGAVGIFAESKHPEAAAEFLRWYSNPESNFGQIEAGFWMPNRVNWYTDEALLRRWIDDVEVRARLPASAFRTAIAEVAINDTVTYPAAWYYTPNVDQLDKILISALIDATDGTKTVAQIIGEIRPLLEETLNN